MQDAPADYYEALQISPNADPEMIHRVYRLLAQRLHPDNGDTGDADKFRLLTSAYAVLSNPEERARYDISYHQRRQDRWRMAANTPPADNDFDEERHTRLVVLEILYTRRRMEPADPGMSNAELSELVGKPREHLEFTYWYLSQRKLVTRTDSSDLIITAEGVDYLEQGHVSNGRRRLTETTA